MLLLSSKGLHHLLKVIPRRGLERQVVLLLLGSVSWGIWHIVVSGRLLADIQEVDVLGMNTKLCSWGSVLAFPLVNLDVAVNGQNLVRSFYAPCRLGLFFSRCHTKVDEDDRQSEALVRITSNTRSRRERKILRNPY